MGEFSVMSGQIRYPENMVFGLDIGTRSIVGIVGYKENEHQFKVVAMTEKEHETRAMMDGQIHDINKVADTITQIRRELERKIDKKLNSVCIAAAGRVLRTVTVSAEYEFSNETVVTDEHIHSLELYGVENAYEKISTAPEEKTHFYCVGYTVIHYYMNDYMISNLEGHKANKISADLLATFLPEEVIDGLYAAVEKAGLYVANLTLEPIAAINVAIPENYRLLNIALVDVGAGTSDISITKDGSIVAYGMMPFAGDEITESIAKQYLVDFQTAEKIKQTCMKKKPIMYKDIIGISHKVTTEEVIESVSDTVKMITKNVSDKIKELNGGKSVSAVFIVGGGGKLPGFVEHLANELEISAERVAIRGPEVLGNVDFSDTDFKKDSLYVTPVGICLNFYEHNNNFIFVHMNGERVKLYDNGKLTIVDAAIQLGFPKEKLFPQRGKAINFTINGNKRLVRGELGEAAVVKLNEKIVGLSTPISQDDIIEVQESTVGKDAEYEVRQLPEYYKTIEFIFNGKRISCPKFVKAGEQLVSGYYTVKDGDAIQILNYYTLEQVLEFMDIEYYGAIFVNHVEADLEEKIYENFTIEIHFPETDKNTILKERKERKEEKVENETKKIEKIEHPIIIKVTVNEQEVTLTGKESYILVDVLDVYSFDLSVAKGSTLITTINGILSEFTTPIKEEDIIQIYWKE